MPHFSYQHLPCFRTTCWWKQWIPHLYLLTGFFRVAHFICLSFIFASVQFSAIIIIDAICEIVRLVDDWRTRSLCHSHSHSADTLVSIAPPWMVTPIVCGCCWRPAQTRMRVTGCVQHVAHCFWATCSRIVLDNTKVMVISACQLFQFFS